MNPRPFNSNLTPELLGHPSCIGAAGHSYSPSSTQASPAPALQDRLSLVLVEE